MAEELDPNSVNELLDRMMEITEELLDMNESSETLAGDADEEPESEEEQEDVPMEVEPQEDLMFEEDVDTMINATGALEDEDDVQKVEPCSTFYYKH